ncbi:MAG: dienelactone hydrolase family protein [Chloroflexi bacterium]|nr:dienelactone hydrolase family protein [Chloroflexota bacterium]
MWNQWNTDSYSSILAELIRIRGYKGDIINAYLARPLGRGPYPGIVLVHHLPGWDELYREMTRRFTEHGYVVICPNLYQRFGHGTPEEVAAKARGAGGVADDSVVGDCSAAMEYLRSLPYSSGRVGMIGTCSGGRHAFLVACRVKGFDVVVDCWGGKVVMTPDQITPQQPVAPIDYTKDLSCPILGLFGNDDQSPSPEQVNQLESELKKQGKAYEFHRYDSAGHGFWYYDRPAYRPQQAMDGWQKVFTFFGNHLRG